MSRIRVNVFANLAGQAWSSVMGLLFVPVFIKLMGIDSYGLVGLYVSLQSIFQILDLGLSPTMNREMARYSALPERASDARDFVRTLEIGYWTIGVAIGLIFIFMAPILATQWIRSERLSTEIVTQALVFMGVMTALQWPLTFYGSGLLGLQKQVMLNGINIVSSTLNNVGAVLILTFVSPTIIAFFQWQIAISAICVIILTVSLWHSLPKSDHHPRMRPQLVSHVWRFAAGMSGLSITAVILSQMDKLILSRLLGLEVVGYYTLAGVIANGVTIAVNPVFNAIFPRFSALVATEQKSALQQLYHLGSQLVAILVVPLAAIVAIFSASVLLVWTGNPETARIAAPIVCLLTIGTGLNGLVITPYALQLAHGKTKTLFVFNCVAVVVLLPLMVFLASRYGAIGAATVWVILNISYILLFVPLTHRLFMKGQTRIWFVNDIGLPALAALVGVCIAKLIMPPTGSRLMLGLELFLAFGVAFIGSSLMIKSIRLWLKTAAMRIWRSAE